MEICWRGLRACITGEANREAGKRGPDMALLGYLVVVCIGLQLRDIVVRIPLVLGQ